MSNNKSGSFFKFKNVQVVHRPNSGWQTRQNTQITTQGTVEDHFTEIVATAHAEALRDIDDILMDGDNIDYSPPHQQPIEPWIQVQHLIDSCQTLMTWILLLPIVAQIFHLTLQV